MNKTIAIFNQAGGVGKSTITMNLGYELYRRGRKTLLIDMDQQGSLTDFLGIESADIELNETIGEAIKKGTTDVESLPIKSGVSEIKPEQREQFQQGNYSLTEEQIAAAKVPDPTLLDDPTKKAPPLIQNFFDMLPRFK